MDFAVPADHRVNLKESGKRDKYLDFASELKSMEHESDGDTNCNCSFKRLEDLETRGQVETIQITALLKSARIERRVLPGDLRRLVPSNPCEKLSDNAGGENSQEVR